MSLLNKLNIILPIYLMIVLVDSLLMPPVDFISISNFIFPFALILVTVIYRKERTFWIIAGIVALNVLARLLINYWHGGINTQEVIWSVRWVKLFTVAWSTYYVFQNHRALISKSLIVAFSALALINIFQLMEIDFFLDLYDTGDGSVALIRNNLLDSRVFGSFLNPNNNGFVMALFGLYFLISDQKYKYHWMAVAFVLLIMTQSRTALVAFVAAVFLWSVFAVFRNNRRQLLIFLGIGLVLGIMLIQFKFMNLSSLFDGTAFNSNSVDTRLEMIANTIEVNSESVWTGQGKVNDIPSLIGGSIDNEYAFVYLEYGLIGILIYLIMLLVLIIGSLKSQKGSGALLILIIAGVMGFTNLSFGNLETAPILMILFTAGLFYPLNRSVEKTIE